MLKNQKDKAGNDEVVFDGNDWSAPTLYFMGNDGNVHPLNAYRPNEYEYRSQHEYPYSYSPFIVWGEDRNCECVYTDRLFQWDHKLTDALLVKHFGSQNQYFNCKRPELVEKFLQERLNLPNLKLVTIVEWCNMSSGFPLWSLHYTK